MSIESSIKKEACLLYAFVFLLVIYLYWFYKSYQSVRNFVKIRSFTIVWEALLYAIHLTYQPIKKRRGIERERKMNSSYETEEYNSFKILSSIITTTTITTAIIPPMRVYSWIIAYELTLKIGF